MADTQDTGASLRETGSREPSPSSTGLGPSGFDPARFSLRAAYVFTRPGQVARVVLADGFRFLFLIGGQSPQTVPIHEPGEWEIDIPRLLAKGRYPIVLTTVDAAHVKAMEAVPSSAVDDMLSAIATETRRAETTGSVADEGAGPQDIAQTGGSNHG